MLKLYTSVIGASAFMLKGVLKRRTKQGKEDPERINERMGEASVKRPDGPLVWFHAASVGEAQSTLILIDAIKKEYSDFNILVTTGTVTSAKLMAKRLPTSVIHQYYPLDHPKWVGAFLDHWKPDMVLWMESEIWPNMLTSIKDRNIPAALINARLSPQSFRRWKLAAGDARKILETFNICLTQTEEDAQYYRELGSPHVIVSDNLKYSAAPLPYSENDLKTFKKAIGERPVWVYASTHDPEEEIACRIHKGLKQKVPDLLTIIVPRHPERRPQIKKGCEKYGVKMRFRSEDPKPPQPEDEIYIADTMGELGLFYRLAPVACIGRTFSGDGGGGHNPIEAAQLDCAILHGLKIQNLQQIFDEFDAAGAALKLKDEKDFQSRLEKLMLDTEGLAAIQNKAHRFANEKSKVLQRVMDTLAPIIDDIETEKKQACA